jgi:hypothetical protein
MNLLDYLYVVITVGLLVAIIVVPMIITRERMIRNPKNTGQVIAALMANNRKMEHEHLHWNRSTSPKKLGEYQAERRRLMALYAEFSSRNTGQTSQPADLQTNIERTST